MSYFLAVDAGGTKAEFVLADDERVVARVRTGTIKRMRTDEATAAQNLREALAGLTRQSGVKMSDICKTCIGTAGETVTLVTDWLRAALGELVSGELEIIGDVEVALDAAFHGGRGVLVLAGTGSNVAGRSGQGTIITAGGWGPQLADQGSGHFIGLEGLRRGFMAIDQERATRLLDVAMEHWSLSNIDQLVGYGNAIPAPDYSKLAPLVVQCAAEGDAVAIEVLERAGTDLAELAGIVIERIRRMEDGEGREFLVPQVAFAGSVLEKIDAVRASLQTALLRSYSEIRFQPAAVDPVMGALWRARRTAGRAE